MSDSFFEMKKTKPNANLRKTLRDLEKSLSEWDSIRVERPAQIRRKESQVAMKTHLLLLALKDQIDELS